MAIFILGPCRHLVPGAGLVRLADTLGHCNRAEGGAHVTDIGAGVVFLGLELGQLLRRAHVGVAVLEAIFAGQVFPGAFPVGPGIGHAHAVDGAFLAGGVFQRLEVRPAASAEVHRVMAEPSSDAMNNFSSEAPWYGCL